MTQEDRRLQLLGFRLTTVEILYHMPDYPALLQSFVWQQMDQAPRYPRLHKFLEFWRANLDGALHSVTVAEASKRERGIGHARHLAILN